MNVQRAYSLFEVKALDDEKRTFSGWATTPTPDRMGDVVDPMGAKFKNPLVLLHQHDRYSPIGLVRFEKPTAKGIQFEAEIPAIEDEGSLKDRVDTAWGEIKHGLIRAVSIGFRALKYAFRDDGGIDFQEVEIYELSTVSVPANADALISAVKSMDGRPLSRDLLEQIKTLDFASRRSSPVQLIAPQTKNLNGAVRLIRP
ncbi:HK97 family phage prohead protease [Castellaniella ginsengisoli]|uniref:HK97 family phage prohead protease n=1 Tax=Castellaniella ginsengisoli TaxID=546114 RepID=A0AB39EQZ2_9BURK